MDCEKKIDIPFGAKNSELKGWEYTIPEGMEAEIKDGKVIVREKESEDEKIRKEIISFIEYTDCRGSIPNEWHQAKRPFAWLAYLEKQKEQKDYRKLYEDIAQSEWFKKAYAGKSLGCDYDQKEQKPTEWKPVQESLEALMYAIEGKWEMIKPTSYLSRRLEDLYEGLVNTFNVDESLVVELPKTTYSAKDIKEIKALKRKIDESMEQKPVVPENDYANKPAEWSEGDESAITTAIRACRYMVDNFENSTKQYEDAIERLKSLRPQLKQEDRYIEGYQNGFADAEKAYNNGVSYHIDNPNIHKLDPNVVIHSTTDGTDVYCPHWKPSEEQMFALNDAVFDHIASCEKTANILESLYNDLQKLL